ncbi:MAG: hypothetical protein SGI77_04420 [Pirellulaceae bacterium]|nr:hypothetical protein [Pirellulaceae bacterium]
MKRKEEVRVHEIESDNVHLEITLVKPVSGEPWHMIDVWRFFNDRNGRLKLARWYYPHQLCHLANVVSAAQAWIKENLDSEAE